MQLLEIEGKRVRLTTAGDVLFQQARGLLAQTHSIAELAANLGRGWEAEIRVAFDSAFPLRVLTGALRNLAPISRGTQVTLREVGAASAEAALRAGNVDVLICERVPDGYLGEPLAAVALVAVCAPTHQLAADGGARSRIRVDASATC